MHTIVLCDLLVKDTTCSRILCYIQYRTVQCTCTVLYTQTVLSTVFMKEIKPIVGGRIQLRKEMVSFHLQETRGLTLLIKLGV